jgi:hypothetical protein
VWRFKKALETPLMAQVGAFPGLAYHIIIAAWMDFAGVDQSELWKRRVFELFGLLSEYSMAIDQFVDTPEGGRYFQADPELLWRHPDFARYSAAMAYRIREKSLPRPVRYKLLQTIQAFRYAAIRESLLHAVRVGPLANLESVLSHKEATSGAVFGTCVDLMSIGHELPASERAKLRTGFTAWGMALQVTDDLRDLAIDYNSVQNIVASALLVRPTERTRLEAIGMHGYRLPDLAPETYAQVKSIFNGYLTQTKQSGLAEQPLNQLLAAARTLFWLGTVQGPARVFRGYVSMMLHALGSHNDKGARRRVSASDWQP